ncbi:MAG TPA: prephenate dehydrogenase/arogenate dehydrogenase family protein [Blastocatellia bacterium]|nr:prephenate dehydrogenase/arogenate dehydrogenase family protein [Blastocatellia bacterium]
MQFKHVAIVGLGLIGGSFALALKRARLAERITAWDDKETIQEASRLGIIDGAEDAFGSGQTSEADLIYLAAPVGAIINFMFRSGGSLKPGAIVTDAGSTKREICEAAREKLSGAVHFVGGHPMAGSHKRGIHNADADLFRDAPYAIVPREELKTLDEPRAQAVNTVIEVVSKIGGKPIVLTTEEHDRIVARISHAPQLISTALAAGSSEAKAVALAGSGFTDMTRLAASDWSVWEDICRTNGDEIVCALDEFNESIALVREAIRNGDFQKVQEAFRAANRFMDRLQSERGGLA